MYLLEGQMGDRPMVWWCLNWTFSRWVNAYRWRKRPERANSVQRSYLEVTATTSTYLTTYQLICLCLPTWNKFTYNWQLTQHAFFRPFASSRAFLSFVSHRRNFHRVQHRYYNTGIIVDVCLSVCLSVRLPMAMYYHSIALVSTIITISATYDDDGDAISCSN